MPPNSGRSNLMSKRTSKRATRRKKSANHGKRPNGS
ncbi:50S ribosomal protein bL37 [Actinophytocola sp.]